MKENDKKYKTEKLLIEKYGILLSVGEVALVLKYKERTIRNLMSSNNWPIPIVQVQGSIRMHVADVAEYINSSVVFRKKRGRPRKTKCDYM